jgi:hypothetical protein
MTGWTQLVELSERELALVRSGDWDLVAEVSAERVRLRDTLPTPGPRALLVRLAALEADLIAALRAARATTARELGALNRGRGAVRGYAGASAIGPRIGYADHRA